MRSSADVLGLFSINVVSFSPNLVLRGLLFSNNVVPKPRILSVRAVYILSSLQLNVSGSSSLLPLVCTLVAKAGAFAYIGGTRWWQRLESSLTSVVHIGGKGWSLRLHRAIEAHSICCN